MWGSKLHPLSGIQRLRADLFKATTIGDQMFSTNEKHVYKMSLEHLVVPENKDMLKIKKTI